MVGRQKQFSTCTSLWQATTQPPPGGGAGGRRGGTDGGDETMRCPKCGDPCKHVETFVSKLPQDFYSY